MTLLSVERIKLFSTKSPWWSIFLALGLTIGFAGLFALQSGPQFPMSVSMTQRGHQFGLIVVLIMATLAVTTEYRFGTIRATFQAVPNRTAVMLAKTALLTGMALVIGEVAAFGSWVASWIIAPEAQLALNTAAEWRNVAGVGLVFAGGAVYASAVGMLVRQTAGAVTLLTVWIMLVESLVGVIPTIGRDIQEWMPFMTARRFLTHSGGADVPIGPWSSLLYFLGLGVVLLIIAVATVRHRDA